MHGPVGGLVDHRDVRSGRQAAAAITRAEVLARRGELQTEQPDPLDSATALATGTLLLALFWLRVLGLQPSLATLAVLHEAEALLLADVLAHAPRGRVPSRLFRRGRTG